MSDDDLTYLYRWREPRRERPGAIDSPGIDAYDGMDWSAVATLLAERSTTPLAIVDAQGRIRLLNAALEKLMGFPRYELIDKQIGELCIPPEPDAARLQWLKDAFRGALRAHQTIVRTRDASDLQLTLELAVVGAGSAAHLLLEVQSVRSAQRESPRLERYVEYEINAGTAEFGILQRISSVATGPQTLSAHSQRCYTTLHSRSQPCVGCPVLRSPVEPWPRTAVWRTSERPGVFELVTAELVGRDLVRITARSLTDTTVSSVLESRVTQLADDAGLSERERLVFKFLVAGHSIDEIATRLSITKRTVKFHQANTLEKLGAESRLDLLRLIL